MKEEKIIAELKRKIADAVKVYPNSALLFSGGLDTSILASLNPQIQAITVSLESYGEDAGYAGILAKRLNLQHRHLSVKIDEAVEAIPAVIKILESFDPAIPNDLVVYFGLRHAAKLGIKEVGTGDGADELFAGYGFMEKMDNLGDYIRRISQQMQFSSNRLGKFFNIKISQPFLNKEVIDFAHTIPAELKIREEGGTLTGKWILRKAFEDLLPPEIVWQNKRPLEIGSGMTELRKIISSKISDNEFEEKKSLYPIRFLNKEHLYYYEIYRREVGEIPAPNPDEKTCAGCGAGMRQDAFHCKVCGWVI